MLRESDEEFVTGRNGRGMVPMEEPIFPDGYAFGKGGFCGELGMATGIIHGEHFNGNAVFDGGRGYMAFFGVGPRFR